MSLNGEIVIDLDSHIVERVDRFYQDSLLSKLALRRHPWTG